MKIFMIITAVLMILVGTVSRSYAKTVNPTVQHGPTFPPNPWDK